jgi:ABC-type dipeptide/oligopeptide/nickel transport system ATPase subunit
VLFLLVLETTAPVMMCQFSCQAGILQSLTEAIQVLGLTLLMVTANLKVMTMVIVRATVKRVVGATARVLITSP